MQNLSKIKDMANELKTASSQAEFEKIFMVSPFWQINVYAY